MMSPGFVREYPCWLYHVDGRSVIVDNPDAAEMLGPEWADSPAAYGHITAPSEEHWLTEPENCRHSFGPPPHLQAYAGSSASAASSIPAVAVASSAMPVEAVKLMAEQGDRIAQLEAMVTQLVEALQAPALPVSDYAPDVPSYHPGITPTVPKLPDVPPQSPTIAADTGKGHK